MDAEVSGPFPDVYEPISGPFPDGIEPTQVALLDLSKCTSYFTFEPNQEKHKPIKENGQKVHLVLDSHFYDLTPLNRAKEPVRMELVNP